MTMAVDQGCDCDSVHGQNRSRSNHPCVRRTIEATMIRNRSPAKQQRLTAGSQFWSIPSRSRAERCNAVRHKRSRNVRVICSWGLSKYPSAMRPDRPRPASRE
jgi:hypothetical protein